jgi:hypothetical protein
VIGVGAFQGKDDDPRATTTIVVLAFGSILVFVIILALQTLFFSAQEAERQVKTFGPPEELSRLRAGQLERLNAYRWVDASKGVVAIPIDRAMELVVRDQGRAGVNAAGGRR